MAGIRTAAAAELLGVSPSTLRSWERRLGYPEPARTPGNHRHYDLEQIEALREALHQTGNISSAVEVARRRGRGPTSPARPAGAAALRGPRRGAIRARDPRARPKGGRPRRLRGPPRRGRDRGPQ